MKLAGIELPPVLADALRQCRAHFMAAAVFSLLINILYLAPTLYMLQVYDRVVPTGGKIDLAVHHLALALALLALSGAGHDPQPPAGSRQPAPRCPARAAHPAADDGDRLGRRRPGDARFRFDPDDDVDAGHRRHVRCAVDPIFLIVCFMLHFWIGDARRRRGRACW